MLVEQLVLITSAKDVTFVEEQPRPPVIRAIDSRTGKKQLMALWRKLQLSATIGAKFRRFRSARINRPKQLIGRPLVSNSSAYGVLRVNTNMAAGLHNIPGCVLKTCWFFPPVWVTFVKNYNAQLHQDVIDFGDPNLIQVFSQHPILFDNLCCLFISCFNSLRHKSKNPWHKLHL